MNWDQTRTVYLNKLGQAQELLKKVQEICNQVPTDVPDRAKLQDLSLRVAEQVGCESL